MSKNMESTKHIYGAYLNMARQNAYIALSHISKLLGEDEQVDENELIKMKAVQILINGKSEEKDKTIKLLHKHFPFLKPLTDNFLAKKNIVELMNEQDPEKKLTLSFDDYFTIMTAIFKTLNLLRNQYTHYYLSDKRLSHRTYLDYNKSIVYGLKRSFDGGRRLIKRRFSYKDEDMKFIIDNIRKSVDKINKKTGLPEKDKNKKNKKVYVENENFFYKLDNTDKLLSDKGLAFFICLFLEKKYITLFLNNTELHFFPGDSLDIEKKIILEIISAYRMRLPKGRLDSTKPTSALGLDILNELKKCPDELFDTLCEKDQSVFRIKAKSIDDNIDYENEVLMKRDQSRFPYFAMRYIDDNELFEDIRFQVSLGKYRYKFYKKKGIDSETYDRVRSRQKELNGFGRLSKIEDERKEKWSNLIRPFEKIKQDIADEDPYITDQYAKYIVNGNRIGLSLDTDCFIPKIKGKDTNCKVPDAWLSVHELPGMLFHHLLCDKDEKSETEEIIKDCIKHYRDLFNDIRNVVISPFDTEKQAKLFIKEKYSIDYSNLPDKIQDFLIGHDIDTTERFITLSKKRIENMINRSKRQLKKLADNRRIIGSKDNKLGKENYVEIKAGHLARILSEDIMLMQPNVNNGKDKLTGMNFQIMQSSLAIYDKSINELKKMFVAAGLYGGDIAHPFLSEVLKKEPKNTIAFYETYMHERVNYLNKCLEKKNSFSGLSFLYPRRQKWAQRNNDFYVKLTERYIKQPIELPRGLFTEAIKAKLKAKYKDNQELIAALGNEKCNVTFLINEYFTHICEDSCQPFYNFKRGYIIFDKLNNIRNNKKQLQLKYHTLAELEELSKKETIIEKIDKYVDNEYQSVFDKKYKNIEDSCDKKMEVLDTIDKKKIEDPEFADLYVDVMVQKIQGKIIISDLKKLILYWERLRLKHKMKSLYLDYKKNEKLIRQYKVQDMLLFLMSKNIILDSEWGRNARNEIEQYKLKNIQLDEENENILSIKIPFSINLTLSDGTIKTIKQDCLKLKNYGDFFRFIYDQRIATLLPKIESVNIDRELLEKELEGYDLNRTVVLRLAQLFEKSASEKYPNLERNNSIFSGSVKITEALTDQEKTEMILIRNAFCHNNYPKTYHSNAETLPNIASEITKYFDKLVKESDK